VIEKTSDEHITAPGEIKSEDKTDWIWRVNSKSKHEPTLLPERNDKMNLTIMSGTQGVETKPKQRLAHVALSGTCKISTEENHVALTARLVHRPNRKQIAQRDFLRSNIGMKRKTNNTDKM
jgi:hypothetical protein